MERTDVLIIGGGPVGIQAARMLKTARPDQRVIVLRPESYSVIYCAIPYAIEGLIEMSSIAKKDELITSVGAELWRVQAVEADLDRSIIKTEDGRTIEYNQLLIAAGAVPVVPPVPGKDLENILTVKTANDTSRIIQLASQAKRAVVVGAGAIGIEQAQALKKYGLEVDLVDMAEHPLSAMIDKEFGEQIIEHVLAEGIRWHGGTALKQFEGGKAVNKVIFDNGESIDLEEGRDFVVLCIGVRPELGPFAETDLERGRGGLIVNERMQTSHPNVYAAGDCTQFISGIDGEEIGGKLATNAVPMAKVAAKNMLGMDAAYPGFFNGAATCVGEWRVGGTGFTEALARSRGFQTIAGWGETTSRFPIMPDSKKVQIKLVAEAETGRLLGGQVIAAEAVAERIDLITFAIQQKLTVNDLAGLSYSAQPWQTFFPANNAIVQASEDAKKHIQLPVALAVE